MYSWKEYVAGFIAILLALAVVIGGVLFIREVIPTRRPHYIECGMCGAHVLERWYITGSDGELVEVCEYCYLESRDM